MVLVVNKYNYFKISLNYEIPGRTALRSSDIKSTTCPDTDIAIEFAVILRKMPSIYVYIYIVSIICDLKNILL